MIGSMPRSLRASICSVTFMEPTSAVMEAPTLATSRSAGMAMPSSRRMNWPVKPGIIVTV